MATAGMALVAIPLLLPHQPGLDVERFPVDAAQHLDGDRVFHSDATGGYLIFSQWPDRLVYVDDRAELYQDQYVLYTDVAAGRRGWREELERWEIDQALLENDRPLAQVLIASGWTVRFEDESFVVLDRTR